MRSVWKYECPLQDRFSLQMPPGAEALSVGVQALDVVLWALVDPNTAEREERWFRICGTGHPTAPDDAGGFLGTVQFLELVFHVFQEGVGQRARRRPLSKEKGDAPR